MAIVLPTVLCCYLAVCSLAGLVWQRSGSMLADEPNATPNVWEPNPRLTPIRRQPSVAERQTAGTVSLSTLPRRDLLALARRLQGLPPSFAQTDPGSSAPHELGDKQTFWLHNVDSNSFFSATTTLQYETPHAYWWVEDGYLIALEALERSARNFEERTYPTNHRVFGSEWNPGIDGNPHVYIFLGQVPSVGGYFSSPDEYPVQVRPQSNQHEMFYINLDNAMPGDSYFDGILAHEFEHMIHWAIDRDEDTWVNEGLAELAGQINGYDVGRSDRLFTANPDTQLTTWPELEDSGAHYGAAYLFLAYFLEQYGEEAVRRLVAEPANGIDGFDAVLAEVDSRREQFSSLYGDWLIANYLDDPSLAKGRYGYSSLQIDPPRHAAYHTTYPVDRQATVHQYAADYVLLEGEGTLSIQFSGSLLVPLVGNSVHSGDYQWWANRGDESDTTLTRAFDLSRLQEATLQFWAWYDLETDYDYAYVEVSTDEGQTWDLLSNEHTITTNPSGNSYGPAFTGISGGGEEPHWVRESFDLTQYVGRPVLVRFEVISDDTVNRPGLCLDDIAIPELGYQTDVESGPDGWQAEGWVRVTDHIPQDFLVQLITLGDQTHVERLSLDDQMHGAITVAGLGDDVDRAVLVISAMAPATTEWATYSYRITQQ